MVELKNKRWKEFNIPYLFKIKKGNQNKMNSLKIGSIPLISAKKFNNGLKCFVEEKSKKIFNGNCITINNDGDGGAGLTFYQPNVQFALDSHCTALYPDNDKLNELTMKFISCCMNFQAEYYGHSHSLSNNRMNTYKYILPLKDNSEEIDFEYMEQYIKNQEIKLKEDIKSFFNEKLEVLGTYKKIEDLEKIEWKSFKISDYFHQERGKEKAPKQNKDGNTPIISETDSNNGYIRDVEPTKILKGNAITISINSSKNVFYQPFDFCASVNIVPIYNSILNEYIALFICAELSRQHSCNYDYGYKTSKERINGQEVMLPINKNDPNNPDFEYMEQYVKNLMIEKIDEYLEFIEEIE